LNILDRAEISGFWGDREISINFHKDVNFFIGVNGSGKTTVINIIAAALSADFATLDKLPFNSLRMHLSESGGRKRPTIEIEKSEIDNSPFNNIVYRIKEKASDKFTTYSLGEFEEELLIRRGVIPRTYAVQSHLKNRSRGILAKLNEIANTSWLSIHRASTTYLGKKEESFESSVDQKLEELSTSLAKYFSVLSAKVSDEIAEFQRNMILSLLTEQTQSTVFTSVKNLNLDEEKKSLAEILTKLNIKTATTKLDKQYDEISSARTKLNEGNGLHLKDLMSLVGAYRSHKVVQDWNKLLEKQTEILQPKITFVSVLNELFQRKIIAINQKNEIEATTTSGKKMSVRGFSSGEKQLIIILGEALLQQSTPWIYITDEPELSLHVKWQEKLVESLRKLNPKAQIVCATHSPDVVSSFSDRVFNMEHMIK